MKKSYYYTYIIVFFVVLLLPLALYPAIRERLDLNSYENRTLMTFDEVRQSEWKNFFPCIETYIKDHMPYKNESVSLINQVDEHVFHDLYNSSVVVGKDNWLFYKKDSCIQDYRGGYVLSEGELQEYITAADSLDAVLKDRGMKLCLMITPNKEAVYGEKYLPDKVKRYSEYSRADQIVAALEENTDITVIYPKDVLMEASDNYQVWRKYDTHWNGLGAFVASQNLLDALEMQSVALKDVTVMSEGQCSGDLAGMLGRVTLYADDMSYKVSGYNENVNTELLETLQQPFLPYVAYGSDSANKKTLLCIGDSFLGSMEQYLATNFNRTWFVHRDNYTALEKDLILEEKPDIVVFQAAERFLIYFDDYMRAYASKYNE